MKLRNKKLANNTISAEKNKKKNNYRKRNARTMRFYLGISKNIATIFVILGMLFVWWQGYHYLLFNYMEQGVLQASSALGFKVEKITVEGRNYTDRDLVLAAINVKRGQPIFSRSLTDIREDLQRIDWIKDVVVKRILPNHLHLSITERRPIAIWQEKKTFYIVDNDGAAINIKNIQNFRNLPMLVGEEAPQKAPAILEVLQKFPLIKNKIKSLVRVRKRRWDLYMNDDVIVKLPEINLTEAIDLLQQLYNTQRIIQKHVISVDLRIQPKIFVKFAPEVIKNIPYQGKEKTT